MLVQAGQPSEVVTFVETLLPDGVEVILCNGIAYVAEVKAVNDLPEWASAAILGGTVYVPKALER